MKVKYNHETKKLVIEYELFDDHLRTLFTVQASDDESVCFENRSVDVKEDLEGNDIRWEICDELVDLGLLYEDEESYDVCYILTDLGKKVLDSF